MKTLAAPGTIAALGFVLLLGHSVTAGQSEPQNSSPVKTVKKFTPRIIANDDCDSSFYTLKSPYTSEQLYPLIDVLKGTQVDVYIYCVNRGGDIYAHRTKVGEMLGDREEARQWGIFKEMIEKQRGVQKARIDPLAVLTRRAHEQGLRIWVGFRMNDIHEDFEECAVLRSEFKKKHPKLLMGAPYPEPHDQGNSRADYSWAWNWAKEEVRNRFLALITEACGDYDVDGVELDFLRGPYYFKTGEQRSGMTLMNEFIRQVRSSVNRISKQKNRDLTLAVRVNRTIADCEAKGLDVRTWLNDNLVDVMTPMHPGRLDMQADVRSFVEPAGGRCRIAGGIEGQSYGYGYQPDNDYSPFCQPTLRMLRAAAAGYFDQGAQSVYLFNYLPQVLYGDRAELMVQDKIRAIQEIGDPRAIDRLNKHYTITIDQITDMYQNSFEPIRASAAGLQLPAEPLMRPGEQRRFTLWIGDDVEAARRDGLLKSVWLRASFEGYQMPEDMIRVQLNGQALDYEASPWRQKGMVFGNVPVRKGFNEFIFHLIRRREQAHTPIVIKGIELMIDYKNQ
jgi:hypothetical protein